MDRISLSIGIRAFFVPGKGASMAKAFTIIKKKDLLTKEETIVYYTIADDEDFISRHRPCGTLEDAFLFHLQAHLSYLVIDV